MSDLRFTRYDDATLFFLDTKSILETQDIHNSLMIGSIKRWMQHPERYGKPYMASVFRGSEFVIAATRTPPNGIILSYSKEIDDVILQLIVVDVFSVYGVELDPAIFTTISPKRGLTSVVSLKPLALRFAELWCAQTGQRFEKHMHMTIYKLTAVSWPASRNTLGFRGRLRLARDSDRPVVRLWLERFHIDCGLRDATDFDRLAETVIEDQKLHLWEVDAEVPDVVPTVVAMAARARPTEKGITINMVYTPPEHRGKGYSSITMATLSSMLLTEGYEYVSLFADVNNLISNRVYQKVGFVAAGEHADYGFYDTEEK